MAVFNSSPNVEALTNYLIEIVTGFEVIINVFNPVILLLWFIVTQPTDENFDICYRFCKSNFKFHRYLDVNSNNVSRVIKKLVFFALS